jgi:hypothetical protein
MKVEQVSQGEVYVKIEVDLKHTNKILTIKTKQVEPKKKTRQICKI